MICHARTLPEKKRSATEKKQSHPCANFPRVINAGYTMTRRTRSQLRAILRPLAEAAFCLLAAPLLYLIAALIFAL
jgi:hypothetical protein